MVTLDLGNMVIGIRIMTELSGIRQCLAEVFRSHVVNGKNDDENKISQTANQLRQNTLKMAEFLGDPQTCEEFPVYLNAGEVRTFKLSIYRALVEKSTHGAGFSYCETNELIGKSVRLFDALEKEQIILTEPKAP